MAEESDGIEEAVEGALRVAVMAASRAGEQIARRREQAARTAQAHSQQRAAELAQRVDAERQAARAHMAVVYRPDWWDTAGPQDIARTWQTIRAWSDVDPEAARAEQRVAAELRNRYDIDTAGQAADPADLRDAMGKAEQTRAAARADAMQAAGLLAAADAADRLAEQADAQRAQAQDRAETVNDRSPGTAAAGTEAAELRSARDGLDADSGVAYDSAERRHQLAAQLDGKADPAVTDARVRADTAQGRPPTEATRSTSTRTPKARKTRAGRSQTAQRPGLSR